MTTMYIYIYNIYIILWNSNKAMNILYKYVEVLTGKTSITYQCRIVHCH